jgi:hypothetical protein
VNWLDDVVGGAWMTWEEYEQRPPFFDPSIIASGVSVTNYWSTKQKQRIPQC